MNVTANADAKNLAETIKAIAKDWTENLTPNQQRKATIERAKAFVAEHTKNAASSLVQSGGNYVYQQRVTSLRFM